MKTKAQLMKEISEYEIVKKRMEIIQSFDSNKKVDYESNKQIIDELFDDCVRKNNYDGIFLIGKLATGFPVDKVEKLIVSSGVASYMYITAKEIKGVSIQKLADAIAKTDDPKSILQFVLYIKGVPKENLINTLIELRDPQILYELVKRNVGPQDLLKKKILEIGDFNTMKKITPDDQSNDYLMESIINSGNEEIILNSTNKQNVEEYVKKLMQNGDTEIIYSLAKKHKLNLNEIWPLNYGEYLQLLTDEQDSNDAKKAALDYLLENRDNEENIVKLNIYFDFLKSEYSTIEYAMKCDKKYQKYLKHKQKTEIRAEKKNKGK